MDILTSRTFDSPASSKLKRRQTAVSAPGHEGKKAIKTYGSKTTLDDLGLHRANPYEGWDVPKTKKRKLDDDEIDTIAVASSNTTRKRRASTKHEGIDGKNASSQNDSELGKSAFGTQSSMHSGDDITALELSMKEGMSGSKSLASTTSQISQDDRNTQEQRSHQVVPFNNNVHAVLDTNNEPFATPTLPLIDREPKAYASMSALGNMLAPEIKHAAGLYNAYHYSKESDIANTPSDPSHTASNPSIHATHNSDRMTTPTASSKSIDDTQVQFNTTEAISKVHMPELDHDAEKSLSIGNGLVGNEFASSRLDKVEVNGKVNGSVTQPCTQNSTVETIDELSLPLPTIIDLSQDEKPMAGSQRKADSNEFGSDEADFGYPKEQYQPRPSRSRSNRAVDNLVQAIDYSKRPEAVLKARKKTKRSKTTGDLLDIKPSLVDDELPTVTASKDANQFNLSEVYEVADKAQNLAVEVIEPKKKRGRPKKQAVAEREDDAEKTRDESAPPVAVTVEIKEAGPTQPAKRGRKRKKTEEDLSHLLAEQVTEDTMTSNKDDDDSKALDHASLANVLSDAQDKANKTQPLSRTYSPEATPAPIKALPAPLQTPQKQREKGPDKHSPLNSGKVAYRVGLSKKQRIEPLLRAVRK